MVDRIAVFHADMREALAQMAADGVLFDSCVCDPPYHLTSIVKRFGSQTAAPAKSGKTGAYARQSAGFMGKQWDGGDIAMDPATWRLVYDVLKPGAHLVAFGGSRTFHRVAVAIEDAGFELRDTLLWLYGTGFPKSQNIGKAIDKRAGAEREVTGEGPTVRRIRPGADQHKDGSWEKLTDRTYTHQTTAPARTEAAEWEGWGTALKPAVEMIILARKPLSEGSVAANVLEHGTGAINVDGCRIETGGEQITSGFAKSIRNGRANEHEGWHRPWKADAEEHARRRELALERTNKQGRWPANVLHDGSPEVVGLFPSDAGAQRPVKGTEPSAVIDSVYSERGRVPGAFHGDSGSAARFFYSAKADKEDRFGSKHPTVKPIALMRWLARLVTPPGGHVLDPFAGSGTTGIACLAEGFRCMLVEREAEYVADIEARLAYYRGEGKTRLEEKQRNAKPVEDHGPLFGDLP